MSNVKYTGLHKTIRVIFKFPEGCLSYNETRAFNSKSPREKIEFVMDKFLTGDAGDERESEIERICGMEPDIEKDGEAIFNYTMCHTVRDFEIVTLRSLAKLKKFCTPTLQEQKQMAIKKEYQRLKREGEKLPTLDDLVFYVIRQDGYQDKLKLYERLIELYKNEIDAEIEEFNNGPKLFIPWQ